MRITLNIEAGDAAELKEAIAGLAGITSGVVALQQNAVAQPESKKQKRGEAPKPPEKQPDPKPEEEPELTPDPVDPPNEEPAGDEPEAIPTVVDLRSKAQEKGTTPAGKTSIKALLDEFKSKSISDVSEDKRVAFMRRLEAL